MTVRPEATRTFSAIVIGGSAGGVDALEKIFTGLPEMFNPATIIVLHLHPSSSAEHLAEHLEGTCKLRFSEAMEKQKIVPGTIYLAPANYHLLVETDGSFSLSADPKIKHSRPSIDVLFISAAEYYQENLLGILLSGASDDGCDGMMKIRELGGYTIVQSPETAQYSVMPQSAIQKNLADLILSPEEIGRWLNGDSLSYVTG